MELEQQQNPIISPDIERLSRIEEIDNKFVSNSKPYYYYRKFLTVKNAIWCIDVISDLVENIMGLLFLLQSHYPNYAIFIIFILIDLYKGYVDNIVYLLMYY